MKTEKRNKIVSIIVLVLVLLIFLITHIYIKKDGRVISSKGNIEIIDVPSDSNPLCGRVLILRKLMGTKWKVKEIGMCEANVLDVNYGFGVVTLKISGGSFGGPPRYVKVYTP